LKAGQGTGKTHTALGLIAQHDKVVILAHRRSLAADLESRFNSLGPRQPIAHYKKPGLVLSRFSSSVALVLNSLVHLNVDEYRGCTVLLEEVSQLLRALSEKTFDDIRAAVLTKLGALLRAARYVVATDKDVGTFEMELLTDLCGVGKRDVTLVHNTYVARARKAHWHEARHTLEAALNERAQRGKKLFVASDSETECRRTGALLEDLGLNVFLFTGKTDSDAKDKFMRGVNDNVQQYDALVVSPSMFTGVDLSVPYFDDVFLLVTNTGHYASTDYMQALHRVRHPKGEVHVWVQARARHRTSSVLALHAEVQAKLRRTQQSIEAMGYVADLEVIAHQRAYEDYYIRTAAHENEDINNLKDRLRAALEADGYLLTRIVESEVELAEAVAELSDANKGREEVVLEAIRATEFFAGVDFETGTITYDFRDETPELKVARAYYRLNGKSQADWGEIVQDIDPQTFRARVDMFELIVYPLRMTAEREAEQLQMSLGIEPRGQTDKAQLLKAVIGALGGLSRTVPLTHDDEARLLEILGQHQETLWVWYRQKPPKPEKLISSVGSLLAKAGLGWATERRRVNGIPKTLYSLDQNKVALMLRVAARRRDAGMLGGQYKGIEFENL
jgi:hypothetical protein